MWLKLCCSTLMVQASVLDGFLFDAPPFSRNGFSPPIGKSLGWP